MKLPRDPGDWHEGHLRRAIEIRDRRFMLYEARVDFHRLERSEMLYAAYLRASETVEHLMLALYGRSS